MLEKNENNFEQGIDKNGNAVIMEDVKVEGEENPTKTEDIPPKRGNLMGELKRKNLAERKVVEDLLSQGKNVEIVEESKIQGVQTPDFIIDGVPTELKTLNSLNTGRGAKHIENGFKQHASVVILDARPANASKTHADEIFERAKGKYPNKELPGSIEIWTNVGVFRYP
ncbi:MAG: hypothetical protein FWG64_13020 [Firmicutes bacterium]|nr:hypothetical protein [Bacillota bacterium]